MKTLYSTLLFAFLTVFGYSQDTFYFSATDTFNLIPNGYSLVEDITILSGSDVLVTNVSGSPDFKEFVINGGHDIYTMNFTVTDLQGFNENLLVKVNSTPEIIPFSNSYSASLQLNEGDTVRIQLLQSTTSSAQLDYELIHLAKFEIVNDTVLSRFDTLSNDGAFPSVDFTLSLGYGTYPLFYTVKNWNLFNGDFTLKVNGVVDTTISFIVTPTDPYWVTHLNENDVVNMSITDNNTAYAKVWSDVVYSTYYIEIENGPMGVKDYQSVLLPAYPNPTFDNLNFSFKTSSQVSFQLFDMVGRMVNQGQMFNNTINVSDLPNGMYVINLNIDGNILSDRFIKR